MQSAPDPDPSAQHPLLGQVLRGSYRIVRIIGRGGMGTVFEAEHVRLRRRLAVKVLAKHLTSDSQALARFHREAEIISHLQHPHVVHVVDYDATEAGEPYIVMEFLEGESLEQRFERETRLPLTEVVRIVHQVAAGLAAAHRASIVHRDLKPANVFLVNMPGESSLVKLLDFGISSREGASRKLTGEYDVIGTPDYMSPEQAAGYASRLDHRADQYSLAVIAYEALAAQTPFPGRNVMDVLRQVLTQEPLPLERVAPDVPAVVWPVLSRALAKDPAQRFANVLEFSSALSQAAGYSVPPDSAGRTPATPTVELKTPPPPSAVSARAQGRYRMSSSVPDGEDDADAATGDGPATLDPREINHSLARAREAFGLSEVELAANYVEHALQLADALGEPGQRLIDAENALILGVLQGRVGSLAARLVVRRVPSTPNSLNILPEQAFLLSRLEGNASVEEVLDLSPLPRRRTLRHLVAMLQKGILGIEG